MADLTRPRLLAEWAPQDWLWIGFPHLAHEWPGMLPAAQEEIAAFANAVADSGQTVKLIVRDAANEARARELVSEKVVLERCTYGDIWLRDTGPLTVFENGKRSALRFGFNGWGGKYAMPGDESIGEELAGRAGLAITKPPMVLEGGAIDCDGTGLGVTTVQCLLNPNRNGEMTREAIESELAQQLGITRLLWLGQGLLNDHTDGHVDNLARFVSPGTLAMPQAANSDDPNAAIYADAKAKAEEFGLAIAEIPSPGIIDRGKGIEPASYANFVIANDCVIVPIFGAPNDQAAISAIAELYPGRECIGLPANAVLSGGGGFHCASQHMPSELAEN
ncbi:MAG: agmatine deiminase family protein [Erythrobacter sp.]